MVRFPEFSEWNRNQIWRVHLWAFHYKLFTKFHHFTQTHLQSGNVHSLRTSIR